MYNDELYIKIYQLLNKSTPIRTDCGKLCGKACCRGSDEELGMYLFPEEQNLLKKACFLKISETELSYRPGKNVFFASCNGNCDRSWRPLACRIFPLTPYLTAKDLLIIKNDPRAFSICPLAKQSYRSGLDSVFIRNVRNGCRELLLYEETKTFLRWLSELLDECSNPNKYFLN